MIQDKVYVVSYNGGVLGVYKRRRVANIVAGDYQTYNYKGIKVEEFNIYE